MPSLESEADSASNLVKTEVLQRQKRIQRPLPSRDSEIRGAIVRIAKNNTILKRPVNKLFAVEYTYHDTNQADKARHKEIASPFTAVL